MFLLKCFVDNFRLSCLHIISRNHFKDLTIQIGFCPLLNVYFNHVQINRWLYLSSNLWEFLFPLFRKRIDQKKFPYLAKITELYQLPKKVMKKRSIREAITKRYAFQATAKNIIIWLGGGYLILQITISKKQINV